MLKPKKRITRQQIKEDKLLTFAAKASDFYNQNARNILAGAGIIVVLAVVVAFFVNSRAQADKAASYELIIAKIDIGRQNYDEAVVKLSQIIETYSGTRSAGEALFFLGNVYLFQENWTAARTSFDQYLDRYGRDPQMTSGAIAGLAFTEENEQQYIEAAEHYLEASNSYPHEYNAPQYLIDAGRCFALAGERERARNAYQTVVDRYETSMLREKAENELKRW